MKAKIDFTLAEKMKIGKDSNIKSFKFIKTYVRKKS